MPQGPVPDFSSEAAAETSCKREDDDASEAIELEERDDGPERRGDVTLEGESPTGTYKHER